MRKPRRRTAARARRSEARASGLSPTTADDPPIAHRHDAVGARGQPQVVGDQHQGRAALARPGRTSGRRPRRRSPRRDCRWARRRTAGRAGRPGRGPGPRAAARRRTAGADSGVRRSRSPTRSSQSRAVGAASPARRAISSGAATFSSAVMLGSRWKVWNTSAARPRRRRARPSSSSGARSWPNRIARPRSASPARPRRRSATTCPSRRGRRWRRSRRPRRVRSTPRRISTGPAAEGSVRATASSTRGACEAIEFGRRALGEKSDDLYG